MINGYCVTKFDNNGVQSLFADKEQEIHQIKGLFSDLVLYQILFPINLCLTLPQAQSILIPDPNQSSRELKWKKNKSFFIQLTARPEDTDATWLAGWSAALWSSRNISTSAVKISLKSGINNHYPHQ